MRNQEHTGIGTVENGEPVAHPEDQEKDIGQEHHRQSEHGHEHSDEEHHRELHIFVNRRKFGRSDGVKEKMTGAEIAALVGVPAASAVVRHDSGSDKREIGVDEVVHIKNGEHFLVTRKVVEGGYVA